MLVDKKEAMEIVRGCKLASSAKSNGYSGRLCDIKPYAGKHGSGYTITQGKITEYWVYPNNVISEEVYNGQYSVSDACMTANNIHHVKYNGVQIVPSWQLELDTLTGESTLIRTEKTIEPIKLAGHKLTVMWRGDMCNTVLRYKIRRKLKELLNNGNAVFFRADAQ